MKHVSAIVVVDHTPIHVVSWGKGLPIMLIHGLTNNWEGHIPIATALSKHYRVIIPDLPGYGDSGVSNQYSIGKMARYVAKLIEALDVTPVAIVGLSMGGLIAAECARVYPHVAKTAVVMGPVLKDKHPGVDATKHLFQFVSIVPGGRRILKRIVDTRAAAYLLAKYINMYRFDRNLIDRYGMRGKRKMTPDAYVEMGISSAEYDLDRTLQEVGIPTLLVFGREDKISAPTHAKTSVIPTNSNLTLSVIAEAGHIVSLEKSEETAGAIMEFLHHRAQVSHPPPVSS